MNDAYSNLMQTLGHRFNDIRRLEEALRHSSYVNEQPVGEQLADNERLEFLGDAVLNLAVSHILMEAYPDVNEGDLSRIRACLVNEAQLATIARSLDLGNHMMLGKGETKTGGQDKDSILANTMEAVIAAIYLDCGFDGALTIIRRLFDRRITPSSDSPIGLDHKSHLQEVAQRNFKAVPRYDVLWENGPDHDKTFCVSMTIGDITAQAEGKNKKAAEQEAARIGLELLQQTSIPDK